MKYQLWLTRAVLVAIMGGLVWGAWTVLPAVYDELSSGIARDRERAEVIFNWAVVILLALGFFAFFATAVQFLIATFWKEIPVIRRNSWLYRTSDFMHFDGTDMKGEHIATIRVCPAFLDTAVIRWAMLAYTLLIAGILIGVLPLLIDWIRTGGYSQMHFNAPVLIFWLAFILGGFALCLGLLRLYEKLPGTWHLVVKAAFMTVVIVAVGGVFIGTLLYFDPGRDIVRDIAPVVVFGRPLPGLVSLILASIAMFAIGAVFTWMFIGAAALFVLFLLLLRNSLIWKAVLAAYYKVCLPMKVKFTD